MCVALCDAMCIYWTCWIEHALTDTQRIRSNALEYHQFILHENQKFQLFLSFENLEFATVTDDNRSLWLSRFWSRVLDFLDKIHATSDLTKHYVAAIEPWADHSSDKKLNRKTKKVWRRRTFQIENEYTVISMDWSIEIVAGFLIIAETKNGVMENYERVCIIEGVNYFLISRILAISTDCFSYAYFDRMNNVVSFELCSHSPWYKRNIIFKKVQFDHFLCRVWSRLMQVLET